MQGFVITTPINTSFRTFSFFLSNLFKFLFLFPENSVQCMRMVSYVMHEVFYDIEN